MRPDLLGLLACPACGGKVAFASLEKLPSAGEDVVKGLLACASCKAEYPIEDSVPRMAPPAADRRVRRTSRSFAWEWLRYPGSLPEDRAVFLEETQIPAEHWRGRRVLDAGCGMGRYARVALELGAEVTALDLSEALTRLIPLARENPRLNLVQGDLLAPPLAKGAFDIVYSQGVLHHAADTRRAFERVAALAKKGGAVTVWVYGRPGSYASFRTNPLRASRTGLKAALPAVWLLVWVRMVLSDALRVVTTRLPVPLLYALCQPLSWLGALPLVKYLTFSVHRDRRVRLIENFDWLAPPFQTKHTKEELASWFSDAGLSLVARLPHGVVPKIGALGRRER